MHITHPAARVVIGLLANVTVAFLLDKIAVPRFYDLDPLIWRTIIFTVAAFSAGWAITGMFNDVTPLRMKIGYRIVVGICIAAMGALLAFMILLKT